MNNQIVRFSLILSVFLSITELLSCCEKIDIDIDNDIVGKKVCYSIISDSNNHNAFTDLIYYKDKYYCVFREAKGHVPFSSSLEENGVINIYSSIDCISWLKMLTIRDDWYDLRDPEFAINDDDDLIVYFGYHHWQEDVKEKTGYAILKVDNDELKLWKKGNIITGKDYSRYWLWDVFNYDHFLYGIAYMINHYPVLLKSEDGISWSFVSEIPVPGGTEGSLSIMNNRLVAVFRNNYSSISSYCVSSDAPYKTWTVIPSNIKIESPSLIYVEDKLFVCGREICGETMSISLYLLNTDDYTIKKYFDLNAKRECGYPGMVYHNGMLAVSYYSSKEIGLLPSVFCAIIKAGL